MGPSHSVYTAGMPSVIAVSGSEALYKPLDIALLSWPICRCMYVLFTVSGQAHTCYDGLC